MTRKTLSQVIAEKKANKESAKVEKPTLWLERIADKNTRYASGKVYSK